MFRNEEETAEIVQNKLPRASFGNVVNQKEARRRQGKRHMEWMTIGDAHLKNWSADIVCFRVRVITKTC